MLTPLIQRLRTLALLALSTLACSAIAVQPAELLAGYSARAAVPASAARGEKLFLSKGAGDFGWSCASCHTETPTGSGRHALSSKPIAPLAPAANPERFTDRARVEGWFRSNCQDVFGRVCTDTEKADVLAWLLSLKP